MPLLKSVLKLELQKFIDPNSSVFEGFPSSAAEAASKWANAIKTYAFTIIPVSATPTVAAGVMTGLLAFNNQAGNGMILFETGFTAFATSLAAGMSAVGFTGIPPISPLGFSSILASFAQNNRDSDAVINKMVDLIDLYFKTGTAAPIPTGVPIIFWS